MPRAPVSLPADAVDHSASQPFPHSVGAAGAVHVRALSQVQHNVPVGSCEAPEELFEARQTGVSVVLNQNKRSANLQVLYPQLSIRRVDVGQLRFQLTLKVGHREPVMPSRAGPRL